MKEITQNEASAPIPEGTPEFGVPHEVPADTFAPQEIVETPEQADESAVRESADDAWSEDGNRFWLAATAILILGVALRQWNLAAAPFHPDEGIHAIFANDFVNYKFDPVYHAPLLYHLITLVFWKLGDNDFTARLVPSLLGIGLLAVVVGSARRFLGARAALWGAGLLAVSPVMVTYSRRLLHDSLVLILTLGAVLCFQAARENSVHNWRGRSGRIGLAACLALLLSTKANSFFIIAMLGSFWLMTILQTRKSTPEFRVPTDGGAVGRADTFLNAPLPTWLPIAALGFASAASVWALRDMNQQRNEKILMLASLLAVGVLWEWLRRVPPGSRRKESTEGESPRAFGWLWTPLAVLTAIFIFTFMYGHGVRWPHAGPFGSFELQDNLTESWREAWGSPPVWGSVEEPGALRKMLKYWGGQQKTPRLAGRHDYYLVLMALYELPVLVTAILGIAHASRKRAPFTDLLMWWAMTSWILYAMANEKVPWLMCNMILPLALMGGVWLGQVRVRSPRRALGFSLACCAGFIYLTRNTVATNFERFGDNHEPMFYAQITEKYRDALFEAVEKTRGKTGDIWYHPDKNWPTVWYLRNSDKRFGARSSWTKVPPKVPLRFVVQLNEADWNGKVSSGDETKITPAEHKRIKKQFAKWPSKEVDFLIWPRPSWPALWPPTWARWWWTREATQENHVLAEWSHSPAVVSIAPQNGKDEGARMKNKKSTP